MSRPPTEEERVAAAAEALRLLTVLDALLTGWVLQFPSEEIVEELGKIYDRLDRV